MILLLAERAVMKEKFIPRVEITIFSWFLCWWRKVLKMLEVAVSLTTIYQRAICTVIKS